MLLSQNSIVRTPAHTHCGTLEDIPKKGSKGFMTYVSPLPYSLQSLPGRSIVTASMKENMMVLHQRDVAAEEKKIDVGTAINKIKRLGGKL